MFIGRETELGALERLYSSQKFEFAVLSGNRRSGKTALVTQFLHDREAIYFSALESSARLNFEALKRAILSYTGGSVPNEANFSSYPAALEYVFRLAELDRLIFVIDEFPYVARAFKPFASSLQLLIDKFADSSRMLLIVTGSSLPFMERTFLNEKAPMFKRTTERIQLRPFEFSEACRYFFRYSNEDKAYAYGIAGGFPQYLLQIDDSLSIDENIKNTFLNVNSPMFEEPENILRHDIREPALYNAILCAIASGAGKLSEIAAYIGEETSACAAYVKNLLSLGILRKETPCGETTTRKTIYTIENNMFRFWYRFIPQNADLIARGEVDEAYARIEPYMADYMAAVFIDICKQYLEHLLATGRSPVHFTQLGRWWGRDPQNNEYINIDIVGVENKKTALFCDCRWSDDIIDVDALDLLIDHSSLLSYSNKYYYMFAKRGFTEACTAKAKELGNASLISVFGNIKR